MFDLQAFFVVWRLQVYLEDGPLAHFRLLHHFRDAARTTVIFLHQLAKNPVI